MLISLITGILPIKGQNNTLVSFCSQGDLFFVPDGTTSFAVGELECTGLDSHLAEFRSVTQVIEVAEGIESIASPFFWVGVVTDAVDSSDVSKWKYLSNIEPNDVKVVQQLPGAWAVDEPRRANENCAALFITFGKLSNFICDAPNKGVCRQVDSNLCNEDIPPTVVSTRVSFCSQGDLFFVTSFKTTHSRSEDECSRQNAHLAEFRNIEQLADINTAVRSTEENFLWVGVITDAIDTRNVSTWKYLNNIEPNDATIIQESPGAWLSSSFPGDSSGKCALLFQPLNSLMTSDCRNSFVFSICRREESSLCVETLAPSTTSPSANPSYSPTINPSTSPMTPSNSPTIHPTTLTTTRPTASPTMMEDAEDGKLVQNLLKITTYFVGSVVLLLIVVFLGAVLFLKKK